MKLESDSLNINDETETMKAIDLNLIVQTINKYTVDCISYLVL